MVLLICLITSVSSVHFIALFSFFHPLLFVFVGEFCMKVREALDPKVPTLLTIYILYMDI